MSDGLNDTDEFYEPVEVALARAQEHLGASERNAVELLATLNAVQAERDKLQTGAQESLRELKALRGRVRDLNEGAQNGPWRWPGDADEDRLETMSEGMAVLIRAGDLRALLERQREEAVAIEDADALAKHCAKDWLELRAALESARAREAAALEAVAEMQPVLGKLRDEVARLEILAEVRGAGCECGDDDACRFVRERDEAAAAAAERARIVAVLESKLAQLDRCELTVRAALHEVIRDIQRGEP